MYDNEEPNPSSTTDSQPVQLEALTNFVVTFLEQCKKGKEKYGTVLMTHNGRDAAKDVMQELSDVVAYVQQIIMERKDAERVLNAYRYIEYMAQNHLLDKVRIEFQDGLVVGYTLVTDTVSNEQMWVQTFSAATFIEAIGIYEQGVESAAMASE